MKIWRRTSFAALTVLLSASLVLAACESKEQSSQDKTATDFNATGLPIVKNKLTLKVAGSKNPNVKKDYNEMQMLKQLELDTNIHVEWDMTPSQGWQEKKNLLFSSGELPDVILNISSSDAVKFGPEGLLIPLEGLIDKYAPNIKKLMTDYPEYKAFVTASDGHIYTLPRIIEDNSNIVNYALHVNKVWLDKLGLNPPKTTEEFKTVLKKFKEDDPNGNGKQDEIPLSFTMKTFYNAFGSFGLTEYNKHVAIKDNKVIFTAIQPEWRDTVKFYSDLYKDGLIDTEAVIQDEAQLKSKGTAKDQLLGAAYAYAPMGFTNAERQEDFIPIYPNLIGPKGDKILIGDPFYAYSPGAFAITSANKSPEITMRWIDQVYEPRTSLQFGYGPIGVNHEETPDGKIRRVPPPAGKTIAEFRYSEAPANDFPYIVMNEWSKQNVIPESIILFGTGMTRAQVAEAYKSDIQIAYFPPIMFSIEENDKLAAYQTDIIDYVNKMEAEWIAKGGIDQAWDNYIEQLKKRGLDDMMNIYQTAYKRYLKALK